MPSSSEEARRIRSLSNGFFTAPGRYQARLVLSRGGEISGDAIRSLAITASALGSSDRLALGSSPAATLSGVVYAPGVSLLDQTVALYIGRQVSGALEEVPLGRYTITGAQEVDGAVTITGYDAMYADLEMAYYPTITGATTAQAVLADVAKAAGLSLVCDSSVADVPVSGVSTGYTLREMAGYMAALMGGNARIGGDGALRVGWFASTGLTLDGDQIYAGGAALAPEDWSTVSYTHLNEKRRLYRITHDVGNPNTGVIEDGGLIVPYTIVSALTDSSTRIT